MNIEVSSLCKSYKKRLVLQNVSFKAQSGDIIGIAGGNGSGKSTLLSILAGSGKADSGAFLLDGRDLFKDRKSFSSSIGYVPQNTVLFEELSGKDNLRLWYSKEELEKALCSQGILSLLDLQSFMNKNVAAMSGGMKKRLSIACALSKNPGLLLLDEPSSALDLACKEKLYQWYKAFAQKGGIIILVTHDPQELQLCSKTFVLKDNLLLPYKYSGDTKDLIHFFQEEGE